MGLSQLRLCPQTAPQLRDYNSPLAWAAKTAAHARGEFFLIIFLIIIFKSVLYIESLLQQSLLREGEVSFSSCFFF